MYIPHPLEVCIVLRYVCGMPAAADLICTILKSVSRPQLGSTGSTVQWRRHDVATCGRDCNVTHAGGGSTFCSMVYELCTYSPPLSKYIGVNWLSRLTAKWFFCFSRTQPRELTRSLRSSGATGTDIYIYICCHMYIRHTRKGNKLRSPILNPMYPCIICLN